MLKTHTRLAIRPLIGLTATVVQSTNPAHRGITGQIIDDTHNTLILGENLHQRMIPKVSSIFHLTLPNGEIARVAGIALLGHPAERLRRAKKLRW